MEIFVFREILNVENFSYFGDGVKANDVTPQLFFDAFSEFRTMLEEGIMEDELQDFRQRLFKDNVTADYVDWKQTFMI